MSARATRTVRAATTKPRLTHFLMIPLGHIPALRERVATFTDGLLANDPAIAGLDPSVIIHPRRLHLTLGVLSLVKDQSQVKVQSQATIQAVLDLLQKLKPQLDAAVQPDDHVEVPLVAMDIMRPGRGKATPHVLHIGPRESDLAGTALKRVTDVVFNGFTAAGLMQDDRPLRLHCTVVNTVYRRPRSNNRIPFDYNAVKNSSALATILQREDDDFRGITSSQSIVTRSTPGNYGRMQVVAADGRAQLPAAGAQATAGESRGPASPALQIDLGRWTVTEVQLCEMGSHASDGAYVCVGSVPLLTPSVAPVART